MFWIGIILCFSLPLFKFQTTSDYAIQQPLMRLENSFNEVQYKNIDSEPLILDNITNNQTIDIEKETKKIHITNDFRHLGSLCYFAYIS